VRQQYQIIIGALQGAPLVRNLILANLQFGVPALLYQNNKKGPHPRTDLDQIQILALTKFLLQEVIYIGDYNKIQL
jgi:hypothetical protein